jgi:hypothetical protein
MKYRILLAIFCVFLLSACGVIKNVKSTTTLYQPPTKEKLARIRISTDGLVRAVPNSRCVDWRLPGAGVMVIHQKDLITNDENNNKKLGMPASRAEDVVKDMATSELYIEGDKPITLDYLAWKANYKCSLKKSFVAVTGLDYEFIFFQDRNMCYVHYQHLSAEAPMNTSKTLDISDAGFCHVSDAFLVP